MRRGSHAIGWLGAAAIAACVAAALWWGPALWWETGPRALPESGPRPAAEVSAAAAPNAQLLGVQTAQSGAERVPTREERAAPKSERSALAPLRPEVAAAPLGVWALVVGTDRQPREGVEVVLRLRGEYPVPPEAQGTSGADGKVWLALDRPDIRRSRWVELAGPGESKRGVEVDPFDPRAQPVVLVVGENSALDVRVVCELGGNLDRFSVQLISVPDLDEALGTLELSDSVRVGTQPLERGLARWNNLPPHTDFVVFVAGPPPYGPKRARVRTLGPGEAARVEVVYSSKDVVLLGRFGAYAGAPNVHWKLWNPASRTEAHPWNQVRLPVDSDGSFCVRLAPDEWQALGPGACLVLNTGNQADVLWAALIPLLHGPGQVQLAELGTSSGTICSGSAQLEEGALPPLPRLGVEGRLPPHGFASFPAEVRGPDVNRNFLAPGELPRELEWRLVAKTPGWTIVGPAGFVPGDTGMRIQLARLWPGLRGRLVPGQALAASPIWARCLHVRAKLKEDPAQLVAFLETDGSFAFDVPPDSVASLAVHVSWHLRPLHTVLVAGEEPLELRLPDGLRVVQLDVRTPDGVEMGSRVREWGAHSGAGFWGGHSRPLQVLLDLPSHDLVVECPGYLDTPVLGVVGSRTVDLLGHSVPIRLHAPTLPKVPEWVRLRPQFSGAPNPRAGPDTLAYFDPDGWTTVGVAGTGEFYVHLLVEQTKEGKTAGHLVSGESSPRILVVDPVEGAPPPVHTVAFDLAAVQRAIDSLR